MMYPGYIYLFRRDDGAYKIGLSESPTRRRLQVSRELKTEVEIIGTVFTEDMPALEGTLHALFAGKRLDGEWFALDAEDVNRFVEISTTYRAPARKRPLPLPEFAASLGDHPQLLEPLAVLQARRFALGQFPDAVYWLMLGPDMLEALARDARNLSEEDLEELRTIVFTRKPRGRAAAAPKKGKK